MGCLKRTRDDRFWRSISTGRSVRYSKPQASFLRVRQHDAVREYQLQRGALPGPQFTALREALLRSPLVGSSTLSGPFESSRGFGVTFRAGGRGKVLDRFPALAPWFDAALGAPAVRALTPWWKRTLERVPNAWYLNVLCVSEGGTVARHIDATLRKPAEVDDAVPEMVSVLYLRVPAARGGELQLWDGPTRLRRLKPRENGAVHFRGDLAHEVCAFDPGTGALRASLVIEQYHFLPEALSRLPEFQLESRAGFGAYLDHHAARPPSSFELDR